jgi:hypothetical protein
LRTESPVAAKAAVDLVVIVDVDVGEKPANPGSQVPPSYQNFGENSVHVHDNVHVHVRWNLLKASRLKARGFDPGIYS